MDVPTILGLVATLGLTLFYIPQLWTAYRAPVLAGFNIPAWIALLIAVLALIAQGTMLGIWTLVSANVVAAGALLFIIAQIIRKRPSQTEAWQPSMPPRPLRPPDDPDRVVDVCPLCEAPARADQSYRVCAACNAANNNDDTDEEGTLTCGQCGALYALFGVAGGTCWAPGDSCDACEDGVLRAPERNEDND